MPEGGWRERVETLEADVAALAGALRDPRTPWAARAVIGLVVAYAASPIDLIPDVIPVVGFIDELVVLPIGFALAVRLTPAEVIADHRSPDGMPGVSRRARWLGVALVLGGWVAVGSLLLWAIARW